MFGNAWPNLSTERWSALTRRGYREDEQGVLHVDADPMIGEMLRTAPPAATANLWPFWRALRGIPMLAIRGAQSDILSSSHFCQDEGRKCGARLQLEVAHRGHAPLLDEPESVAAIDALLRQLS